MTIHPTPVTNTWTARRMLTAVGNETVKGLRRDWSERLQILIELPLFVTFVLLLGFTVGKGSRIATTGRLDWSLDPRQAGWLFIGMATFTYTYLQVQKLFWRLLAEIQAGTLEQTYLSPLPSWVHVVGGRVLAAIAETTVVVAVMYAITSLAVPSACTGAPTSWWPLADPVAATSGAAGLAAERGHGHLVAFRACAAMRRAGCAGSMSILTVGASRSACSSRSSQVARNGRTAGGHGVNAPRVDATPMSGAWRP